MLLDTIMALVGIGFVYSLIPQMVMVTKEKKVAIAWQTLIITPLGLFIMGTCLFLLNQTLAGSSNVLCGLCWAYMLSIKIIFKKKV